MAVRPAAARRGRVRTVFLGSGAFAVPILERLAAHPLVELVAVVTAPPRPVGRSPGWTPTPVDAAAARARPRARPHARPASAHPEAIAAILALGPTSPCSPTTARSCPPALLDLRARRAQPPPVAAAAAPRRDADPGGDPRRRSRDGRHADADGRRASTRARSSRSERVALAGNETRPTLEARLAELGGGPARPVARRLAGRRRCAPSRRRTTASTLTRPLRRDDGRLDPDRPAAELERQVRAYQPWPGTFLEIDGGAARRAARPSVAPRRPATSPGAIVRDGRGLALATADGRLVLDRVQPAGGRPMRGEDFLRGRPRRVLSRRRRADPLSNGAR